MLSYETHTVGRLDDLLWSSQLTWALVNSLPDGPEVFNIHLDLVSLESKAESF